MKKGQQKKPGDAEALEKSIPEFKAECKRTTGINPDSPDPTGWYVISWFLGYASMYSSKVHDFCLCLSFSCHLF